MPSNDELDKLDRDIYTAKLLSEPGALLERLALRIERTEKERDTALSRIEEIQINWEGVYKVQDELKALIHRLGKSLLICDHSGRCIDDVGLEGPNLCDRCEAVNIYKDYLKRGPS